MVLVNKADGLVRRAHEKVHLSQLAIAERARSVHRVVPRICKVKNGSQVVTNRGAAQDVACKVPFIA